MIGFKCFCGGQLIDSGETAIENYTSSKLSSLYECNVCSSIYVHAKERGDLVADYKEAKPNDLNDKKQKFISSLKRNLLLSSWKNFLKNAEGCSIVDFGCGDGNLALYIKELFPQNMITGVDLPLRVPPLLKGSDISYNTIHEFLNQKTKVDYILLRHVLEHIEEPVAFIQDLLLKLNDGGKIIIEVPNLYSFWRKKFGKKWMGYYSPYHYWVYSEKGMRSMGTSESKVNLIGFTNPPHGGYLAMLVRKRLSKPFVALSSLLFYPFQIIPVFISKMNSEGIVYEILKNNK